MKSSNTKLESETLSQNLTTTEYSLELLRLGLSDLNAVNALFDAKCFPQAYFYFQQVVEKSNKAFGLTLGIITIEELFKIQHNQFKIYRKLFDQSRLKIDEYLTLAESFPVVRSLVPNEDEAVERIKSDQEKAINILDAIGNLDLVNVDEDSVDKMLKNLSDLLEIKIENKISPEEEETIVAKLKPFLNWIMAMNPEATDEEKLELNSFLDDKEKRRSLFMVMESQTHLVLDITFIQLTLYSLALVTIQHSSQTRYISDTGINPLDVYTENLTLIRKLPEMLNYLNEAIQRLIKVNSLTQSSL